MSKSFKAGVLALILGLLFSQPTAADPWCGNVAVTPSSADYPTNITVTLQVYVPGVTDASSPPTSLPLLICTIYGPITSSSWADYEDFYFTGKIASNNAYMEYVFVDLTPKSYTFTVHCDYQGFNRFWTNVNYDLTINPIDCPADSYRSSPTTCDACPANSTSPASSLSIFDCTCQGGLFLNADTKECSAEGVSCNAGEYSKDGVNCTACPPFSTSPSGPGGLSKCVCEEGRILNKITASCSCPANTFLNGTDCSSCPNGSTAPAESTDITDCVCTSSGEVLDSIDDVCRPTIAWVGLLTPAPADGPVDVQLPQNLRVTLQVYKEGQTGQTSAAHLIECFIRLSSPLSSSYSGDWNPTDVKMSYFGPSGNNDVYQLLLDLDPGYYAFAAYCRDVNSVKSDSYYKWNDSGNGKAHFFPVGCLADQYSANFRDCVDCPMLSSGPIGSTSISNCTCLYGLTLDTGRGICFEPCAANQYAKDQITCVNCPAGTSSPENSVSASACTCSKSYVYNGQCLNDLNWVGNQNPTGSQSVTHANGVTITVESYTPDQPATADYNGDVQCFLHYSPVSSFGGSWDHPVDQEMTYTYVSGNNLHFTYLFKQPPGLYEITGFCINGKKTQKWTNEGLQLTITSVQCPADKYTEDYDNCLDCPPTSTSIAGSYGINSCSCGTGYAIDTASKQCVLDCGGGYVLNGTCESCPAHSTAPLGGSCACDDGYFLDVDVCAECPANQYGSGGVCNPCPAASSSSAASTLISDCACDAGFYSTLRDGDPVCAVCPAGTFESSGSCQSCHEGMTSPAGSTAMGDCICKAGFVQVNSTLCVPCEAGKFETNGVCETCPQGKSSQAGSWSSSQCVAAGEVAPIDLGPLPYSGGVAFRVWSPHAVQVYLDGEVVSNQRVSMTLEPKRSTWYVEVAGATAGQAYKYVIFNGEENLERADPYSRQLVDSSWPQFSVVHSTVFDWQGFQFLSSHPAKEDLVIYEAHIGTLDSPSGLPAQGTFNSAIERLDSLVALGINALEVMPVTEFGSAINWGYDPSSLFAVENNYGGPEGFKTFVREAHKKGLVILLDLNLNHLFWTENVLQNFDGYTDDEPNGVYFYGVGDNLKTLWGPRPNFDNEQVRAYLLDSIKMWMTEYGVDGFRWDATICIRRPTENCWDSPNEIQAGIQLMKDGNDLIHLLGGITTAEDLNYDSRTTVEVSQGGFGFDLEWIPGFQVDIVNSLLTPYSPGRDMGKLDWQVSHSYSNQIIYVESHDKANPRVVNQVSEQSNAIKLAKIGLGILMITPGVPLMFQGNEFFSDQDFTFTPSPPALTWGNSDYTQQLLALRNDPSQNTTGLNKGTIETKLTNSQNLFVSQHYHVEGAVQDHTIVIINLQSASRSLYVDVPASGEWLVRLESNPGSVTSFQAFGDSGSYSIEVEIQELSIMILSQNPAPPVITTTSPPQQTTTAPPQQTTTAPPQQTTTAPPQETTTAPPQQTTTTTASQQTTSVQTTAQPTTTSANPQPTATEAPSSQPILVVVLRIVNLDFNWYSASSDNADLFNSALKEFFANLLGVPASSIVIISVKKGSIIAKFSIQSSDANAQKATVDQFLSQSNPSMNTLAASLPNSAFEDPSLGVTVDSASSSTSVTLPSTRSNTGAIVGGVIGGLVGLALIGVLVFFLLRKRGKSDQGIELADKSGDI